MPDSTTLLLLTAAALTAGGIYMIRSQNSEIKPVVEKPLQEIVFKPPPAPAVPGVLNIQPNRHLLFGMQMGQPSSQPDNNFKAQTIGDLFARIRAGKIGS